jgi:hypothetical protein
MASAPVALPGTHQSLLSKRGSSRAQILLLAFVTVQALDGILSYVGVSLHGPGIEANPLVGWYMAVLGPAAGFTVAKLFAVMCGVVLYVTARHMLVAILTLVYLIFAVVPWFALLSVNV